MKPNLYIFACITALLFFTGCHDTIFYDINQEVELYSAQVTGDVNSMARFGNYLVTQNGYPWYKSASSSTNGEWSKMAAIPDDGTVWKVAADANYIYAISRTFEEDTNSSSDEEGELIQKSSKVYYTDDVTGEWEEVDTSYLGDSYYPIGLFCTDSTEPAGRQAFVVMGYLSNYTTRVQHSVHYLNGPKALSSSTIVSDATGTLDVPVAAAYCNGNVYFSNYPTIVSDGTTMYWTKGSDTIYYGTSATATGSRDVDCSDILSIAITSDYLLLGTKAGAYRVARDSDNAITSDATSSFSTNARSVLSSYYYIWMMFSLDPTASEADGTLYASTTYKGSASASATYWNNQCLWSYYPSRGNWICE